MIDIYRNGALNLNIAVEENSNLKRTLQGEDEINCSFVVPSGSIDIQVGDYIIVDSRNYYVNRPPKLGKISAVEYRFDVTFEADIYSLLNKLFQSPTTGRGDWSLVETLEGFVDVLLTNINSIDAGWTKGNIPTTERKLLTFSGEDCRKVLNRLKDEFGLEFVVTGKNIAFYDLYENATALTFEHGKGKGLYRLTRDNVDTDNTVSRGWFWGSSKNIDYTYRDGEQRLIFIDSETGENRLDNTSEYSKIVEKQVIFEDIYPSFTGSVDSVNDREITCAAIDFDLNVQLIEGLQAKVVFKTGDLQGMEFTIQYYDHATRKVTLNEYTDEFGQKWPNTSFKPAVGDEFTFVDIRMPSSYVVVAENKLAAKAAEWMAYYSKLRVKYSLDLDPRYLRDNNISLNLGDVVRIIDPELGIDKQIRITSIEKGINNPYQVTCEISNIIEDRWQKQITKQVNDALTAASNASKQVSSIAGYSLFSKYFEIVGEPGSEYILAKLALASNYEVAAYASAGMNLPSIFEAIPVGSGLINDNGVLKIDGDVGAGFDETANYSPSGLWNFTGTLNYNGNKVATESWASGQFHVKGGASDQDFAARNLTIHGTVNHWVGDVITVDDARLQLNRTQGAATVASGIDIYNGTSVVSSLLYGTDGRWKIGGQNIATESWVASTAKAANSNLLDGIDSSRVVYGGNHRGTIATDDPNSVVKSGFYYGLIGGVTGDHGHTIHSQYHINDDYSLQISATHGASNYEDLRFRKKYSGTWGEFRKIWHSGNDGSGSGLDADKLDGLHADSFLRSDTNDAFTELHNGYDWNISSNGINLGVDGEYNGLKFYDGSTLYSAQIYRDTDSTFYVGARSGDGSKGIAIKGNNGFVGILNTTPTEALDVNGNILASGEVTAYSDVRLKDILQPTASVLEKINALTIYDYTRNDNEDKKVRTGLIAQDLQKQFPQFVSGKEGKDTFLSINYSEYAATVATKGIQELYTIIQDQAKRIQELEKRVN